MFLNNCANVANLTEEEGNQQRSTRISTSPVVERKGKKTNSFRERTTSTHRGRDEHYAKIMRPTKTINQSQPRPQLYTHTKIQIDSSNVSTPMIRILAQELDGPSRPVDTIISELLYRRRRRPDVSDRATNSRYISRAKQYIVNVGSLCVKNYSRHDNFTYDVNQVSHRGTTR